MQKRFSKTLLFICILICVRLIYMNFLQRIHINLFHSLYQLLVADNNFWFVTPTIISLSVIIYIMIIQLIQYKKLSKRFVKILKLLYVITLIYLLLFKNFRFYGINLNLLTIFYPYYLEQNILNILLTIPIGFTKIKFSKFLIFIFIMECLQYLLHTGILDLSDIILNSIGFIIGKYLYQNFLYQYIS